MKEDIIPKHFLDFYDIWYLNMCNYYLARSFSKLLLLKEFLWLSLHRHSSKILTNYLTTFDLHWSLRTNENWGPMTASPWLEWPGCDCTKQLRIVVHCPALTFAPKMSQILLNYCLKLSRIRLFEERNIGMKLVS